MGFWQGQVGQLSDFVLNEVANLRVWSSIITLGLPVIDTCKMEDVRRARRMFLLASMGKQGRIHGIPVADGWAGAVMQKLLAIQKCDRRTDRPTDQGVESRVRD